MSNTEFRMSLLHLGFTLTEFTDEDLGLIDSDKSGSISVQECCDFFIQGAESRQSHITPPPPPVDDLIHKNLDVMGTLTIKVTNLLCQTIHTCRG